MPQKIIRCHQKKIEETGYGMVLHSHSDQFPSLKNIEGLESLISIRELHLEPGAGIMPYQIESVFKLVIPLEGVCAARLNNQHPTVVSMGEVQMIKYPDVSIKMEYNPDNDKTLKYLILQFKSKSEKYVAKTFDLKYKKNRITEILSSEIYYNNKEKITLKTGNFESGQAINYSMTSTVKAVLIYIHKGSVNIQDSDSDLAESDYLIIDSGNSFAFKTTSNTKFLIIEISARSYGL